MTYIARRSNFLLQSIIVWTTGLEVKYWANFGSDAWMPAGFGFGDRAAVQ
jgi:hypothetical protein